MKEFKSASGKKLLWSMIIILIIIFVLLIFSGINNRNGSGRKLSSTISPSPKEIKIGLLICMNDKIPFLVQMAKAAKDSASRRNAEVIVLYANDNAALQSRQIRSMIDQKADTILLNPVSDEVIPAVKEALAAGIPVITVDRSLSDCPVTSDITSDNQAGGEMAAEYLSHILRRKGKVVELEGTPQSSAAIGRGTGFNKRIANYPNIQVIDRRTGRFNQADAKAVFMEILKKRQEIDGVFAHNDQMILGAIEAAKDAGRDKDMVFVGFDGTQDAIEAIDRGDLEATVAQKPEEIGRLGVETAIKHIRGETVPKSIKVGLALIIK